MVDTCYIHSVELRATIGTRRLYRITTTDGQKFASGDMFHATLCERAKVKGVPVKIHHAGGWHYRDITHVELVTEERAAV